MELIFAAIGVALAALAIIQSWRANRSNRKAIEAQGVFKKPIIRISLFQNSDTSEFIIAAPLGRGRIIELPLRWEIENTGERSARELEVLIRSSKELWYGGDPSQWIVTSSIPKLQAQLVAAGETLSTVVATLSSLHPNQTCVLTTTSSLRSSTFAKNTVDVETKDGIVSVQYSFEFSYTLDLVVSQADAPPITRRFRLGVVDTSEQTVADFLRAQNAIHSKAESGSKIVRKFRLIEMLRDRLESDPNAPIDRLRSGATVTVSEGVRLSDGFVVPALGVYIDPQKRKRRSLLAQLLGRGRE